MPKYKDECIPDRGHYAACCVNEHILMVARKTHPPVTFYKEIPTLPIPVGVSGIAYKPQQRAPGHKAIHAF